MHTGPTPPSSTPRSSRSTALLIGALAFAVVFLLIVGGTIGFLALRPGDGGTAGPATATSTASDEESPGGREELTEEPSADEDVTEERCWSATQERTSTNPSGRLRGGGLEIIPPAMFTERGDSFSPYFVTDAQRASAPVESTWYSTVSVGKVEWQPGVEYPGDQAASERIFDCLLADGNLWGEATNRTPTGKVTEPVTIAGMPGYRTSAVVEFDHSGLELTDSSGVVVIVLDTPEGPSVFAADWAEGVDGHEEGVSEAIDSLTGLSS